MALGFGNKQANGDENDHEMQEAQNFGTEGYYEGFKQDPERQGSQAPRKMSRLTAAPVTKSIGGVAGGSDDGADISIGKQMEAEAGNAIKYRTCSWQKV